MSGKLRLIKGEGIPSDNATYGGIGRRAADAFWRGDAPMIVAKPLTREKLERMRWLMLYGTCVLPAPDLEDEAQ